MVENPNQNFSEQNEFNSSNDRQLDYPVEKTRLLEDNAYSLQSHKAKVNKQLDHRYQRGEEDDLEDEEDEDSPDSDYVDEDDMKNKMDDEENSESDSDDDSKDEDWSCRSPGVRVKYEDEEGIDPTDFLGLTHEDEDDPEMKRELSKWEAFNRELEKFKDEVLKSEQVPEIKAEPMDIEDKTTSRVRKKRGRRRTGKSGKPDCAVCPQCGKKFKDDANLKCHVRRIHRERPQIGCNFCEKIFTDKTKLIEHKYRIHTRLVEEEQGQPLQRYPCPQCPEGSRVFVVARDLTKHLGIRHSSAPKKAEPLEDKFFCSICGKGYKKAWPLKLHIRRHNNEKPFQCDQCAKSYALKGDLKRHYEINHVASNGEVHMCKTCGKTYPNIHYLKVHERYHSKTKGRILNCPECKEVFKENSALKEHMYYHGEPQFQCRECFQQFRTPDQIKDHLSLAHGQSPFSCEICCQECKSRDEKRSHQIKFHQEQSFPCQICCKEFTSEKYLAVHMKRHLGTKKYACEECGKRYSSQVALNAHISTFHKGEKRYHCDICNKSFGRYNNLTTHRAIHSGVKPFQCIYCSSGYGEKRNLMNHITRNHPGQPLEYRRDPGSMLKNPLPEQVDLTHPAGYPGSQIRS